MNFSINASTTSAYNAYITASTSTVFDNGNAFGLNRRRAADSTNAVNAANAANAAHAYDFLIALDARVAAEAVTYDRPTLLSEISVGTPETRADLGYCFAVSNAATAEVANAFYVAASTVLGDYYEDGWISSIEGDAAADAVGAAFSADCNNSEKMDPSSLLALPVWPDGWPVWFETEMSKYLTILDSPEWEFWKRWYLGMLDGAPVDWAKQREIANIPNLNWEAGPERIADILNGGPLVQDGGPVEQVPFLRSSSPPAPGGVRK